MKSGLRTTRSRPSRLNRPSSARFIKVKSAASNLIYKFKRIPRPRTNADSIGSDLPQILEPIRPLASYVVIELEDELPDLAISPGAAHKTHSQHLVPIKTLEFASKGASSNRKCWKTCNIKEPSLRTVSGFIPAKSVSATDRPLVCH